MMKTMEKENIIKNLVKLSRKDLVDVANCIEQFVKSSNKSGKDNIFIRYMAFRHYHSMSDFCNKNNITRDSSICNSLRGENDSLSSYVKLKKILDIPDEIFNNYLESQVYINNELYLCSTK